MITCPAAVRSAGSAKTASSSSQRTHSLLLCVCACVCECVHVCASHTPQFHTAEGESVSLAPPPLHMLNIPGEEHRRTNLNKVAHLGPERASMLASVPPARPSLPLSLYLHPLTTGAPQSSVLGLLFFIIHLPAPASR